MANIFVFVCVAFIVALVLFACLGSISKFHEKNDSNKIARNLFEIVVVCALFLLCFLIVTKVQEPTIELAKFGVLGDYFGGFLNPLVSFAALIGLWKTLEIQRVSNDKSEKYLKEQIQKDEDRHHDAMFIELMEQYRTVLNDIKLDGDVGKRFLERMTSEDADLMWSILNADLPDNLKDEDQLAFYLYFPAIDANGLRTIVPRKLALLNPYFRMVYHVLKYQSNIKKDIKYKNTKYFRAQLTEDELVLIAVNAMFNPEGVKGLQDLLREFALLKHMKHENLRKLVALKIGEQCLMNEEEERYGVS